MNTAVIYAVPGSSWVQRKIRPPVSLGGAQLVGSVNERLVARCSLADGTVQRVLEADASVKTPADRIP